MMATPKGGGPFRKHEDQKRGSENKVKKTRQGGKRKKSWQLDAPRKHFLAGGGTEDCFRQKRNGPAVGPQDGEPTTKRPRRFSNGGRNGKS